MSNSVVIAPNRGATRERAAEVFDGVDVDSVRPVRIMCDRLQLAAPGFLDELVVQAVVRRGAGSVTFVRPTVRAAHHIEASMLRRGLVGRVFVVDPRH